MTIVRPCIVFGPNVDNYLVRLWTKQPFAADVGTLDNPIQFVHEDDVVNAIQTLLLERHEGAYNVAPDGHMTMRECAEVIESPIRRLPLRLYRGLAKVMWAIRQSEAPPGQIEFALYPWIVSNEKLKRTTSWTPRHTNRETFEIAMRAHGKLPALDAPAAERPAATLAA
jgi:UDP-glucose 4-epimerase